MSKRHLSLWGKRLFLVGLFFVIIGSPFSWFWGGSGIMPFSDKLNPFLLPAIGIVFVLASFVLLSFGSRVGDNQD
jgi:hypothetical protein